MKRHLTEAALFEWLERTSVQEIRDQMKSCESLAEALAEYLPDPGDEDGDDPSYAPDSMEAAEAAEEDEARIEAASRRWGRLTDEERQRLRALLASTFSTRPDCLADWIETLDINMPFDTEEDDGDP